MAAPLLIAQLSDAHVGIDPADLGGLDTLAALRRAVAHVLTLAPAPDVVLFTGDLTERGIAAEYAQVVQALSPLPMPVYAVPGNHDDPSVAREVMRRFMPVADDAPDGTCCYRLEVGGLHLVALDTVVPRRSHGALDPARLAWLERTLDALSGLPVLVFMHHPPLPTGLSVMDRCSLMTGGETLAALIRHHGRVQGLLCGHLHRPVQMQFGGAPVHVAPSVAHQVDLDLRPEAPLRARLEPPKISLHRWLPDTGLCTHLSYVGGFGEPLVL